MTDSNAAPSESGAGEQSGAPKAAAPAADQKASTVLTDTPKVDSVKPADGATADEKAKANDGKGSEPKKKDDGKPQGAPETYADFQMPEGVELDKAAVSKFVPLAKELNLTQEQAQKVVSLYASEVLPAVVAQIADARVQQTQQWLEQSMADKVIGGAHFDANVAVAKKALDSFGTPELKAALDETGLGNHPEVIRLLANIGKRISEDGMASITGNGGGAQRSQADVLYGKN